MKLQIRVNKDGVIEESVFKTFGCGSAIASSSLATEWVKNKNVNEAGRSAVCFSFLLPATVVSHGSRALICVCDVCVLCFDTVTIKNSDIAKELCLPPIKLHCSMLAEGCAVFDSCRFHLNAPLSSKYRRD